jgi:hypothetical protein
MTSNCKLGATLCFVLFLARPIVCAKDMSSMYHAATLEKWAPRYSASTNRILNNFVFKYLTAEERRQLENVRIDFPLVAEGSERGNPLAFYAPNHQMRVVFPIFSMKFLDDLSIAYAWLQLNGYVLDTVSEYTAMLVYKDLGGRYPSPLQALQIPADALQDKKVDELAVNHFVTARMFILLHELGHVYYGHTGRTDSSSIAQEVQADQFALEVMSRSPVPPIGALLFFMADASMAEYPPRARTHPLSGKRLQALGMKMQDPQMKQQMFQLAELLDDPDTRRGGILAAKAMDEAGLTPRRTHQPVIRANAGAGGSAAFHGRCSGQFFQRTDPGEPVALEMVLQRTGNSVRGRYTVGLGTGTLEGTVTGTSLHLQWQWGNKYGRGILATSDNGAHLQGNWGFHESSQDGGTWSCTQR